MNVGRKKNNFWTSLHFSAISITPGAEKIFWGGILGFTYFPKRKILPDRFLEASKKHIIIFLIFDLISLQSNNQLQLNISPNIWQMDNTSLHINSTKMRDYGNYKCTAINKKGKSIMTINLVKETDKSMIS